MNVAELIPHFKKMGATVIQEINARPPFVTNRDSDFTIDIKGQKFVLDVAPNADVQFEILNNRPDIRHLVLMARLGKDKQKFLCGHDERQWFVATVKSNVTTVDEAMSSLKSPVAEESQKRAGVRTKAKHKRHNARFIRQGEWFFTPVPSFNPGKNIIHKKEPINNGKRGGKDHVCDELIRFGGKVVYVAPGDPRWITTTEYRRLQQSSPMIAGLYRQAMEDAKVFVRGKVSHPDHYPVTLQGWHQVSINQEGSATSSTGRLISSMRFID